MEAQEPNQPPSGGGAPHQRSRGAEPDSGISSARSTGTVPWSHNEVGLPVLQERESDNTIRCRLLGVGVCQWRVTYSKFPRELIKAQAVVKPIMIISFVDQNRSVFTSGAACWSINAVFLCSILTDHGTW